MKYQLSLCARKVPSKYLSHTHKLVWITLNSKVAVMPCLPVEVSLHGFTLSICLKVPQSEIFTTLLQVLTRTLLPFKKRTALSAKRQI